MDCKIVETMARVISKESVRRANAAMIHGTGKGVSIDNHNVSVRCRTSIGGPYTMVFSREKIVKEANRAFSKIVK